MADIKIKNPSGTEETFSGVQKIRAKTASGTQEFVIPSGANYALVTALTAWNQTLRMGTATPSITLPAPALDIEEEIRITFAAASANATFTAPSGFILGDENGYAGMSAGNSIEYTDLTIGSIYEVSIAVLDSTHLQLLMRETKVA